MEQQGNTNFQRQPKPLPDVNHPYTQTNDKLIVSQIESILSEHGAYLHDRFTAEQRIHDLLENHPRPPTETELKDLLGILIEIPNNSTLDDIWPSIDRRILDVVHRGLTTSQNKTIEMIPIASLPKNDLENVSKLEELLKNDAFKNLTLINNIEQSSISQTGFAVIPSPLSDNFKSIDQILSPIEIGNLKVLLQSAISEIQNNQSITNKVAKFAGWFNMIPADIQQKMVEGVHFYNDYTYRIEMSISNLTDSSHVYHQSEANIYINWWNQVSTVTRMLLMCIYTIGVPELGLTTSDVLRRLYRVPMVDAIKEALIMITAILTNQRNKSSTYTYPLTNLPITEKDDYLARVKIPELMSKHKDYLYVEKLDIPEDYMNNYSIPLPNYTKEIIDLLERFNNLKIKHQKLQDTIVYPSMFTSNVNTIYAHQLQPDENMNMVDLTSITL